MEFDAWTDLVGLFEESSAADWIEREVAFICCTENGPPTDDLEVIPRAYGPPRGAILGRGGGKWNRVSE